MTVEEARKELPDFNTFKAMACVWCASNDWFCPDECDMLKKAKTVGYERILKSYARNGGEIHKVVQFIRQARV